MTAGAGKLGTAETGRGRAGRLSGEPRGLEARAGRIDTASLDAGIRRDGAGAGAASVGLKVASGLGGD